MRIRSVISHGAQAVAEGALLSLLVVGLMAGTTFAAKGGGGSGGGGTTTSWIVLAQDAGAASVQPTLGATVSFSTGYPSNVQNPRIEVLCYQSGSLVYGEAGAVTDSFLLGGGGSIWLYNGGGPADCTANLFYFGQHAGSQTYNVLATTTFSAR